MPLDPNLVQRAIGGITGGLAPGITPPFVSSGLSIPSSLNLGPTPSGPSVTTPNIAQLNSLQSSGDGISQIQNPLLRGIARTADVAGSVFSKLALPQLGAALSAIPGTAEHHQTLVRQAQQNVANDQAQAMQSAQLGGVQARTRLENDQANAAEAPATPEYDYKPDANGNLLAIQHGTTSATQVTGPDGKPIFEPAKVKTPEEQAFEASVSSGKSPLQAFQEINQAKNTKDSSIQQQYLDNYVQTHPGTSLTDAISKTISATSTQPKLTVINAQAANRAASANAGTPSAPAGGGVSPLVQAIIDGRSPAPNSRSKAGMAIMAQVTAADPTYDASRYNTYQAMQKEMTSGKTGTNINALNTLLEHLKDARSHIPDNGRFSPINAGENAVGSLFGKNPTGKFDTDANGVSGEFGKLVTGGVATVDEQKHLASLLNHNASPETLRQNLDEVEELAHGKLAGIYKQVQSAAHPGAGGNIPSSLPPQGASSGKADYVYVPGKGLVKQ